MSSLFKYKSIDLPSGEVIFDVTTGEIPEKISSQFPNNIVSISTPDALSGGTFKCFVELVKDGGFFSSAIIGGAQTTVDADRVGATVADGNVDAFSFQGNPYRVKVVAENVNGAASANVVITQSAG